MGRRHQIDEHGHPGCRHVQKDDAVDLALLVVRRGQPKPDHRPAAASTAASTAIQGQIRPAQR